MSRADRETAKDHGGFVGGVLANGRRTISSVEKRSMVALDGDRITPDFLDDYEKLCPYTSALYTTHSSTPESPRVRLVFPLTRDVTPEEYVAVARYLAQSLNIEYFDECSLPGQSADVLAVDSQRTEPSSSRKRTADGSIRTPSSPPIRSGTTRPACRPRRRESRANTTKQKKVQDPLHENGTSRTLQPNLLSRHEGAGGHSSLTSTSRPLTRTAGI
ncbi:MAG: hypothetical protein ACOX41_01320 [Anaerovoracaceae bacterium]